MPATIPHDVATEHSRLVRIYGEVLFTGSRAMGVERPSSDWDFVVVGTEEDAIREAGSPQGSREGSAAMLMERFGGWSVYLGRVNLIIAPSKEVFAAWAIATDWCCERSQGVTDKRVRTHVFDHFFRRCGRYNEPCPVCGKEDSIPF